MGVGEPRRKVEGTVVVGVSGSIAAYKAVSLVSLLQKAGYAVEVILTRGAERFVAPLTFQVVARGRVHTDVFREERPEEIAHIAVADRASLFVVAPATAHVLGKLACGLADDFLSTALLAARTPVILAPAMNVHMYAHPVVRENIARLRRLGYTILEPACGPLACGYEGKGRMPEPEEIFAFVDDVLQGRTVLPIPNAGGIPSSPASAAPEGDSFFAGKVVLLTVGATQEPVDPVRFLSNRSSGKMGFALAEAARRRGARVVVVAGATSVPPPPGVEVRRALRAEDMLRTVEELFPEADVFIAAAAVADYRPKVVAPQKIKKGSPLVLELEPTPDILLEMGKRRRSDQVLVGFAAETEDLEENARDKLVRKNLDFLVLNEVSRAGVGFEADENEVVLYDRWGGRFAFPRQDKRTLADKLLEAIAARLAAVR
ncbi:MAG: Phosphopantothenoylcysteine decarboxylase [Brockia lithotrophica]|uniref:Coenzyme A biosynthesis bifunctional protein CoaBC n=1 Tax=Brockia lithotrophica TaxID=933949 RepID=A0A2T5G6E9_9BACL|nr:MAG: Phosphopantothenoylcysteine decarboxylase [Brockia lithotrophica]